MKFYTFTTGIALIAITTIISGCPKMDSGESNISITVSSDVDRFYALVDSLGEGEQLTNELLWDNYIQDGSPALKEVMGIQGDTKPANEQLDKITARMNSLLPFLKTNKDRIKKNVPSSATTNDLLNKTNEAFGGQYKEALSDKQAYFIIGMSNQLGGGRNYGIFFDVAMLNPEGTDFSQHPNAAQSSSLPKDIDFVFVHELAHVIQINISSLSPSPAGKTILQLAILEGGADYLASLVLGKEEYEIVDKEKVDYLKMNNNEATALTNFLGDSQTAIPTTPNPKVAVIIAKWLYNGSSSTEQRKTLGAPGGIADMGYGITYVIARKYFELNKDKTASVKALIEAPNSKTNANDFVTKAGLQF